MSLADHLPLSFEFSPKLGIRELPELDASHQSNVAGLYVVGDLADAPIIKVALNQGFEVATKLCDELGAPSADPDLLDVVVIGAGPAGIGAALALQARGYRYLVLEKEQPFNTIQNFPKHKHIFSEPRSIENKGSFWFEDASKEELVERWGQAIEERHLTLHQPEEVLDLPRSGGLFQVRTRVGTGGLMGHFPRHAGAHREEQGAENVYRAKRVILAIGRRAAVNRLGVPGEDLPKVAYTLRDPANHAGRRVLVVGGGDSAVEAAVACAQAGAEVTISYRQDGFHRAKAGNQEKLRALVDAGKIRAELRSAPVAITPEAVELKRGEERVTLPNDDVLIFAGTQLPREFLKRVGLRMAGEMTALRALWIASFAAFTYLFYVLKSGTSFDEARGMHVAKKAFFPFGPDHPLGSVPDLLHVDLGFRSIDGSFWGTVCYSLAIAAFGAVAYRKYPSPVQKKRYLSLMTFQLIFLFGIPELLAPAIIKGSPLAFELFGGERGWKFYNLTVPWPLNIWALVDAPGWTATGNTAVAIGWIVAAALVSFVLMPLYVWRNNEKFCSYLCGCGGLAETLGDFWRHLAPRGKTAIQAEWMGRIVLFAAIPTTGLILSDAWGLIGGSLYSVKDFAQGWYTLMVDFWLASVVGVALYPYLGNRVWCRFFCPLRAYMELLSKRIGRLRITANDKCIGCGECTRFCQMGIDVQKFAQKQQDFDNTNSACIQCGICVQVCPMEVLELEAGRPAKLAA